MKPDEIAAGLSEDAARGWLRVSGSGPHPRDVLNISIQQEWRVKGLLSDGISVNYYSPLGLAVRKILEKQMTDKRESV